MSNLSRSQFRHVIQICRELEDEAVYECLSSFLKADDASERTFKEVLIRSLGIHIISLASYGRLLSMQGVTAHPPRALLLLVLFFLVPEISLGQLCLHIFRASVQEYRRPTFSFSHWVTGCLGSHVHITRDRCIVPVHAVDPAHLRYSRMRYSLRWFGSFGMLVPLLAQYMASFGIRYRARTTFGDRWNSYTFIDQRSFHLVVGGMAAVVNCMLLALTNLEWRWHLDTASTADVVESTQPSSSTSSSSSTTIVHIPDNPLHSYMSAEHQLSSTTSPLRSICHRLEAYNNRQIARLDHFFPVHDQYSMEGAIFLHTSISCIDAFMAYLNPDFLNLFWLLHEKTKDIIDFSHIGHSDITGFSPSSASPYARAGIFKTPLLPYISVMMILTSFCSRFLAGESFLARLLPWRMRKVAIFGNKWIAGGRSVISFPFFFCVALAMVVWVEWFGVVGQALWERHLDEMISARGSHWDRLHVSAYRYKDPWYDGMYVL
ncbi:unnamed protein product [Periconia digitata]|uniref:Uncharacterized protein n=1 Tax=Periconia digitata TaxID=1303443 RepID=A0A9W4U908_9PLEO|nr:unnamed protein product [Periconia digitata]